ncbi:MAG: hypothetical protein KatS3mg110_3192 [Pirellulaceae bacterium]|nr:MAG: hypothetical protein KatS3mg110_3192 [Pirellulaceae bacterium]
MVKGRCKPQAARDFPQRSRYVETLEQAAEAVRMPGWTVIRHENFTEFIAIEGKAKMQRFNRAVKALTKSQRQIRSSMLAGEHDVWGSLDRKEAARTFRTLSGIPE